MIICQKPLKMSSKYAKHILAYFKSGGNVLCPIPDNGLNSVRNICCKNLSNNQKKYWVKQNSFWISYQGTLSKELLQEHFPQYCKKQQFSNSDNQLGDNNGNSDETTTLTPGFYHTFQQDFKFPSSLQQSKLRLEFFNMEDDAKAGSVEATNVVAICHKYTQETNNYLPLFKFSLKKKIMGEEEEENFDFNLEKFGSSLKTKYLGRSLIYIPVVNSTFDVLDGQSLMHGLAVITDRQLQGRGRGQNKWLSPRGCAMTSFQIKTDLNSRQGQKASLLQHLTSLAVVHSMKEHVTELKLKWPNDIYFGSKIKMGGVVVFSSVFKNEMVFNIGLGFNLDNKKPTLCLNDLLQEKQIDRMSREDFLSRVFNCLESFMDMLENEDGLNYLLDLYHENWLHQDQPVQVLDHHGKTVQGLVKCIDNDGYLKVELEDGSLQSIQPGSNSFDMMQGLILPKK